MRAVDTRPAFPLKRAAPAGRRRRPGTKARAKRERKVETPLFQLRVPRRSWKITEMVYQLVYSIRYKYRESILLHCSTQYNPTTTVTLSRQITVALCTAHLSLLFFSLYEPLLFC